MILRLLAQLFNRAPKSSPLPASEAERRMNNALRRTQNETRALAHDGVELAQRIRRNSAAGHNVFRGKPTT